MSTADLLVAIGGVIAMVVIILQALVMWHLLVKVREHELRIDMQARHLNALQQERRQRLETAVLVRPADRPGRAHEPRVESQP